MTQDSQQADNPQPAPAENDAQAEQAKQKEQAAYEAYAAFTALNHTASKRALNAAELAQMNEFLMSFPTLDRTLGSKYIHAGPNKVVLELTITEHVQQPWGITNGGVYSSLGESAGSMASYYAAGSGPAVMGTSNETHFLRPSKPGDTIVSTATPENLGRTSHLWRIEHRNKETGKLCALTLLKTAVMVN